MKVELQEAADAPVEDPHGEVSVARRSSGLGAVVRRRRAVRAARLAGHVGGGVAPAQSSGQKTVVVIDDESDQVETTTMLLESAGHRVVGSTDPTQTVQMAVAERAQVVIVDFMMPVLNGGQVCEALRADPATRNVRIVILSGTPESHIRQTCTLHDAFLSKPADIGALLAALAL